MVWRAISLLMVLFISSFQVLDGHIHVIHNRKDEFEAKRIAKALNLAVRKLPSFTKANQIDINAKITESVDEFVKLTGLPPNSGAGMVEQEIIFPPSRLTARFENLESVARHELAHLVIEVHAGRGLPRWFVEGLASELAKIGETGEPTDENLMSVGSKKIKCPRNSKELNELIIDPNIKHRRVGYSISRKLIMNISQDLGGIEIIWKLIGKNIDRQLFQKNVEKYFCRLSCV